MNDYALRSDLLELCRKHGMLFESLNVSDVRPPRWGGRVKPGALRIVIMAHIDPSVKQP